MSYPKEIKELDAKWHMIYSTKDPVQFIDLLCFNAYLYGTTGNKIPVDETRTVFINWLERKAPPRLNVIVKPETRKASDE